MQPLKVPEMQPPDILLPSIKIFFQTSCGLSEDGVEMCWDLLKGMIWGGQGSLCSDHALFRAHGNHFGLSSSHCSLPGFIYLIIGIYLYLLCSFEYKLSPPAFLLGIWMPLQQERHAAKESWTTKCRHIHTWQRLMSGLCCSSILREYGV